MAGFLFSNQKAKEAKQKQAPTNKRQPKCMIWKNGKEEQKHRELREWLENSVISFSIELFGFNFGTVFTKN